MVLHDDNETPVEVPFEHNCHMYRPEQVVPNDSATSLNICREKSPKNLRLKSSVMKDSFLPDSEENSSNINITEISAKDLLELKTVYKRCKSVLRKIESKYGHLLDLDSCESSLVMIGPSEKRSRLTEYVEENECQCTLNKKIVFDEDGNEVMINAHPENHICPTKLMVHKNQAMVLQSDNKNIQVEFHNEDTELSDNLLELQQILQKPDIETTYRNKVINKLKSLKQEYLNEIKFNKHSIIEKIKSDPDEILNFKGTNLSGLPGYKI